MAEQVPDQIEVLPDETLVQHGPYNDRIYVMKLGRRRTGNLPIDLIDMARHRGYSKIFVKLPIDHSEQFVEAGYVVEASVPQLFNGTSAGIFMGFYFDEERHTETNVAILDNVRNKALEKSENTFTPLDNNFFVRRQCKEKDVKEMAAIYKAVFTTYPFPIQDPLYLLDSMHSQVDYFGIEKDGKLIALSSAEQDTSALNVEMTDFATLPEWRGHNLATHLLMLMEKEMRQKGIKMAYTIARAVSYGINIIFSKQGYTYGGRLKNNTNISGNIESMNIWHKKIH